VGPVAYETASRSGGGVDRLAVVSWNSQMGRGDLHALVDALKTGRLTRGEPVEDFVLLLQEVYRTGPDVPETLPPAHRLARVLDVPRDFEAREVRAWTRSLNLFAAYVPSMRNGAGRVDRGNAILSTQPLSDLLVVELPFERQRRAAAGAVVSGVSTRGRPWRVHVASVHLDTAPALLHGGPAAARRRQAEALIEALAALDPPVVVGGDLNTSWGADEPAFVALQRAFPDARTNDAVTWRGPWAMSARLDHLFLRTGDVAPSARAVVERAVDRYGSDHYPLVTMLAVGG
jgi:endonuclease/exonuclease/phosphatase family metal-dependent hydrolase